MKTLDSCDASTTLNYAYIGSYQNRILLRTQRLGTIILFENNNMVPAIDLSIYSHYRMDNIYNLFAIKQYVETQRNDSTFLYNLVDKYDSSANFLWRSAFYTLKEGDGFTTLNNPFVVDNMGGLYNISSTYRNLNSFTTRISHLSAFGTDVFDIKKVFISDFAVMVGNGTPDGGISMIHFGDARSAVRFDYNGNPQWSNQPITVFKDPFDKAFFTKCESDYNGGFVCAFWRTEGGVFVKHSGRTGKVGILTRMKRSENEITGNYLRQNYPNPFNSSTNISFSVHTSGNIKITIYDMLGREIEVVHEGYLDKGSYSFNWSAKSLSSGVYIYKLVSQNAVIAKKMLLVN